MARIAIVDGKELQRTTSAHVYGAAVKIDDRRVTTSWIPVVQILEEVIPLFKKEHLAGIRSIILLDDDYRAGRHVPAAAGRYCQIQRSRAGDIEIFLAHLSTLPGELQTNRMLLTYLMTETLAHEVYHHLVRGQQKLRRPSYKEEQKAADRWAFAAVRQVFHRLFPGQEAEWSRIDRILKQAPAPSPPEG